MRCKLYRFFGYITSTPASLLNGKLNELPVCSRPAQENVMNAHGETRLFLVVVNQPKIQ